MAPSKPRQTTQPVLFWRLRSCMPVRYRLTWSSTCSPSLRFDNAKGMVVRVTVRSAVTAPEWTRHPRRLVILIELVAPRPLPECV
jgi:hypothetical protein